MVRAGHIVPHRFRRERSQKNCAGIADSRRHIHGFRHLQFQVLGGNVIGQFDSNLQILHDHDDAKSGQALPGNVGAGQGRQLNLNRRFHRLSQFRRVGHEDGRTPEHHAPPD
jgi:hypothetical protein